MEPLQTLTNRRLQYVFEYHDADDLRPFEARPYARSLVGLEP